MPVPPTSPLPRTLAREQVYAQLHDWILTGTLASGEVLRDQDIATRLGVSRTPVREALRRLEDEGLIETAQNRWTRVAPLDINAAAELYPVIEALEALALQQAMPELNETHLEASESANEALQSALNAGDALAALTADDGFHTVWIETAGNRTLMDTLTHLKRKLRRVELAYFDGLERGEPSVQEHQQLITALRGGNHQEAQNLLRQNWRGSLERLRARQEKAKTR